MRCLTAEVSHVMAACVLPGLSKAALELNVLLSSLPGRCSGVYA